MDGIFMMYLPGRDLEGGEVNGARVEEVAPTILRILGVDPKGAGFGGRAIAAALEGGAR